MVYGHHVMDICRVYGLDLEGYGIQHNTEFKVIESRILGNAHFHNLYYEEKYKPRKYIRLKKGEVRV